MTIVTTTTVVVIVTVMKVGAYSLLGTLLLIACLAIREIVVASIRGIRPNLKGNLRAFGRNMVIAVVPLVTIFVFLLSIKLCQALGYLLL